LFLAIPSFAEDAQEGKSIPSENYSWKNVPVGGGGLVAGIAALVAGAMSMAAGEYVSVSSQADTERADLAREKAELETQPDFELDELAGLYVARGV